MDNMHVFTEPESVCFLKNVHLIISSCWLSGAAGDFTVGHFMCQLSSFLLGLVFSFPLSTLYLSASPPSAALFHATVFPFNGVCAAPLLLFSFFRFFSRLLYSAFSNVLLHSCIIKPFSFSFFTPNFPAWPCSALSLPSAYWVFCPFLSSFSTSNCVSMSHCVEFMRSILLAIILSTEYFF